MAANDKPIKLGIIGCGRVSETRHLPALRNVCEVEVVAAADLDSDRLNALSGRFGIRKRYRDFADLVTDPEIEAVAVCVPARFHVQVALAALERDKHLFIEKPLALTLADADVLAERAARSRRRIMVGFNLRWHRLVRRARDELRQGVLGPVQFMRTILTSYHETLPDWRARRESGGGVLFELAVHHFDLWRYLLGSEVDEIFAVAQSGQWDDEAAVVTARMTNGVVVSSVFSERTSESHDLEFFGKGGQLRVSCYDFDGLEFSPPGGFPGDLKRRLGKMARTLQELPQGIRGMRQGGDFIGSYAAEWRHFAAALRHDVPLESTQDDGRRALEVVIAAALSADAGRPLRIAEAVAVTRAEQVGGAPEIPQPRAGGALP